MDLFDLIFVIICIATIVITSALIIVKKIKGKKKK